MRESRLLAGEIGGMLIGMGLSLAGWVGMFVREDYGLSMDLINHSNSLFYWVLFVNRRRGPFL